MITDAPPEWHRLFNAELNDQLSDAERAELAAVLKSSAEARQLWFLYQDNECSLAELKPRRQAKSPRTGFPWLSWRPLTAAAAGIMFGMFCTSVVFGFVGQRHVEKKTPLAVMQPSFEDAHMPLAKGFPPTTSLWTGDLAKVVSAENGVTPKEGHHMLRLETTAHGATVLFPRLYQVIALPPSGTELREIEVSASFASGDPGSSPNFTIRAYAVNEAPERLGPDWFARHWFVERDEAIASAVTSLDSPPDSTGWKTFGLRIQVPNKARCLVVFFGVKNQANSQAKRPHYLDAVQVSFVESPSIP